MSEQILTRALSSDKRELKAKESLEKARLAHERYLIRQHHGDLE